MKMVAHGTCYLLIPTFLYLMTNSSACDLKESAFNFISPVYCKYYECCNDKWIHFNEREMRNNFKELLYGQHLVSNSVVKHFQFHFESTPNKALVLSFHGTPGTGKNYASQIIVRSIFQKGFQSQFVHMMVATRDFTHQEKISEYKDTLKIKIEEGVKACRRAVFIFDEVDKMPPGVLDVINPYLDHYPHIGGVDYRKATFIFLSNKGGNAIANEALEVWKEGKPRESIRLRDLEHVIKEAVFNKIGGMQHSELLSRDSISAYIPFLPLERQHVLLCIRNEILSHRPEFKYRTDANLLTQIQEIADELRYTPEGINVYSATGCKRVKDKVAFLLPYRKRNEL